MEDLQGALVTCWARKPVSFPGEQWRLGWGRAVKVASPLPFVTAVVSTVPSPFASKLTVTFGATGSFGSRRTSPMNSTTRLSDRFFHQSEVPFG